MAFCSRCGTKLDDGVAFCSSCGAAANQTGYTNQGNQTNFTNQTYQTQQGYQPVMQTPLTYVQPMKWYKFLIYFSLFASAVLNSLTGIVTICGSHYGESADLVYRMFPELKTADIFVGIAGICLAIFAIYTRSRLANFCQNGPKLVLWHYALNTIVSVAYIVCVCTILPEGSMKYLDFTSSYISVATSVIMILANNTYFSKRANLFVN